jgi:uncharacterized 2Fe-2S/4Fe-4S cluster protein (DUF4445 family)
MAENLKPQHLVDFEPVGKRVTISQDNTLLDAARKAGVELVAICGGAAVCGRCKVQLIQGELSPLTISEENNLRESEKAGGTRFACQANPLSDVKLHVPPESLSTNQRLQVEGIELSIDAKPVLEAVDLKLDEPSIEDQRSDSTRLQDALQKAGYPRAGLAHRLLRTFSGTLREQDWSVRVILRNSEICAILPFGQAALGLAVDVGTTKVAGYLVDITSGETLAKTGAMNPQIAYGEDVISRIAFTIEEPENEHILQNRLVETLNNLVAELCKESSVESSQIIEMVAVGNTAMHHLLAGLPVRQLGLSPYVPAIGEALNVPAAELGLEISDSAYLYMPPNIAGYVGADHVSMVVATQAWKADGTMLAIDIGTNTELTLAVNGDMYCCSCASGPAFEGAHILNGMRAAPGAIEHVQIRDGATLYQTIGEKPPVGICGSGILDVIAELSSNNIIDRRGAFDQDNPLVRERAGGGEFLLASAEQSGHGEDIVVRRSDINEIQLAKAAIRAGIEILLDRAGLDAQAIDQFVIAGAFGTYISPQNAASVGMFPMVAPEKYTQVGNAAGVGAKQLLLSADLRQISEDIARNSNYVELTTDPNFQDRFLKYMYFPREEKN